LATLIFASSWVIPLSSGVQKFARGSRTHLKNAVELRSQRAAVVGSCCCKCSDLKLVNRASAKSTLTKPALSTSASSANLASLPSSTETRASGHQRCNSTRPAKRSRQALKEDPHLRDGLNVHAGRVTDCAVADALKLPYTDADHSLRI